MVIPSRMDPHYAILLLFLVLCAACCHAYSPKKPENLSCVLSQDDDERLSVMTCTWDPGADSYLLETTYNLCYKKYNEESCVKAEKSKGNIDFDAPPVYVVIDVWVRVESELRTVDSDKLQLDVVNIIKPSPPVNIRLTPEKLLPTTMMVQWDSPLRHVLPMKTVHYMIRFCVSGSSAWTEVLSDDIFANDVSFRLQNLRPFTDYVVQMYCKISEDNRYWSEWSGNVTAKTPEANLGSPDFSLGTIVPESPVLEIGKEFTATCVLSEYGRNRTKATADDMYWEFGNMTVDKQYYNKMNDSAISLTVIVTKDLKGPLKCNIFTRVLSYMPPKNVHGIFFKVDYPPKKPENLSCVLNQDDNKWLSVMTCMWDPGAVSYLLETTYNLCYKKFNEEPCVEAEKSKGTITFGAPPVYVVIDVWVRVGSELRTVDSDKLQLDVVDIIKPSPPLNIRLTTEKLLPTTMMVQWDSPLRHVFPMKTVHYMIRFCVSGSSAWTEVPSDDIVANESFRLQNLRPFTDYVVQMYCKISEDNRYWSEWSGNVTAKTPEAKPLNEPDLWRVLTPSEGSASQPVKLLWKEPSLSNGVILGYNITIEKADGKQDTFQTVERECLLQKDAIRATLTAYNSVGVSPRATLTVNRVYPQSVESVDCVPLDSKLMVKWQFRKTITRKPSGFVIEWVSLSDGKGDWQREPWQATNATLKGNFQPFKRYNVSVYPIYDSILGTPRTIQAYLKQKAPSKGPVIKVKDTGKHEVQLEWPEIPLDQQNGLITGYTIFYRELNVDGDEKSVSLGPEVHSYKLGSLKKNTRYVLCIMASTVAGSTNGSDFTLSTYAYGRGEVEAIVVSVCIGFLFLTVIIVAICINKHTVIKKRIWPQVPDPSNSTIANWTPDFPTKPDTPKEGSMTDVSVVEVDVFDKPTGEEDKASLHLKKDKYMSDEHSSGIGGSSCMSSPRQSVSDCDEGDSGQTTASTVQYSSVVASGYKGQTPSAPPPAFARSESTQPLLDSEERPDDPPSQDGCGHLASHRRPRNPYFRRPWAVDEDSPTEATEGSALTFCPMEDTSHLNGATTENLLSNETTIPTRSYMAQVSGYRPQ